MEKLSKKTLFIKKMITVCFPYILITALFCGCGNQDDQDGDKSIKQKNKNYSFEVTPMIDESFTIATQISDVINDPAFGDYGRLIFPVDKGYYSGNTLGELRMTWYNNIDPDKTVEIVNYMKAHAKAGETIFYDIYTDEEKAADPDKNDTGLFFFKGKPGARFAVCNAGGGFAYVGAMHDSFPHALELSKKGYNAFALIYRPGAQTACEDLARAIQFIFEHAEELEVNTDCYSLWGGSAGARMAAILGSYGPEAYGGGNLPRPGTVVMQYTGHTEYTENDPPTYANVGTSDGIASYQTMQNRIQDMKEKELTQRLKFSRDFLTVLVWEQKLWRKDGWIGLLAFGKNICKVYDYGGMT